MKVMVVIVDLNDIIFNLTPLYDDIDPKIY